MCWLVLLALLGPLVVTAKRYNICREMVGADFFREFYWWRWDDPTHGTVAVSYTHLTLPTKA